MIQDLGEKLREAEEAETQKAEKGKGKGKLTTAVDSQIKQGKIIT